MRWTPHATVAAVIEKEGRFLLVEEISNNKTVFNQPAGHLEHGESLHDAIIREVKEETAWQFTPEHIIGIYRWLDRERDITYLRMCFTGSVKNHNPDLELDTGILGAHWLTPQDISRKPLRNSMVQACIDDYLSGQRYPLSMCKDLVQIPHYTSISLPDLNESHRIDK